MNQITCQSHLWALMSAVPSWVSLVWEELDLRLLKGLKVSTCESSITTEIEGKNLCIVLDYKLSLENQTSLDLSNNLKVVFLKSR